MTDSSTLTARDILGKAARSNLQPADRAKAIAAAAARIKTAVSADPVETLANELAALALRGLVGTPSSNHDFLTEVAEAIDIAAIEIEDQVHNDEDKTRKASVRLLAGDDYDLSDISNDNARPFVDRMLEEIAGIEQSGKRVDAVNALLRSIDGLPRGTTLGCDEMFIGLVPRLGDLVSVRDMDPTAQKRSSAIMREIMMGGL